MPRHSRPARPLLDAVLIGGCAAFCLWGASAAADVYKWLDREGRPHYTDRPPPAEGRLVSVARSGRPAPTEAPVAPAVPAATAASPMPPSDPTTLARLRAGVAADVAKHDASACQAAQERYRQYVGARHLYRTAEDGTRTYLSDADIEAERIAARREVEEFCGPSP
mgnify:FL=1